MLTTHLNRDIKPRARKLTADDYTNTIGAIVRAGVRRVYFTGGEPLASPLARPVLTNLPVRAPDVNYTLITNGTLVRTHQQWLSSARLEKSKSHSIVSRMRRCGKSLTPVSASLPYSMESKQHGISASASNSTR